MIKECKHRWHFMKEHTNYEYIDTGETLDDGTIIDGYKQGDTFAVFVCDKCGGIKKKEIDNYD